MSGTLPLPNDLWELHELGRHNAQQAAYYKGEADKCRDKFRELSAVGSYVSPLGVMSITQTRVIDLELLRQLVAPRIFEECFENKFSADLAKSLIDEETLERARVPSTNKPSVKFE